MPPRAKFLYKAHGGNNALFDDAPFDDKRRSLYQRTSINITHYMRLLRVDMACQSFFDDGRQRSSFGALHAATSAGAGRRVRHRRGRRASEAPM